MYKRQGLVLTNGHGIALIVQGAVCTAAVTGEELVPNCNALPVSYTHLDVYKRQLQSIQQAGRTVGKDVYLVGVDALVEAVQNVVDGNMTCLLYTSRCV